MSGMFSGKTAQANKPTPINALQVQTSVYGTPIMLIYGRNRTAGQMIDYVGFRSVSHSEKQAGGKGGGKKQTTTSFTYNVTFMLALGEGTLNAVNRVWKENELLTVSQANLTFFNGAPTQTAWPYLTGAWPTHALAYANTAYMGGSDYDLGDSPAIPNFNFDVSGFGYVAGKEGAKPSFILSDYLTHAQHGAGFNFLGSTAALDTYCLARDLYLSPVEDVQRPAANFVKELADLTNCAPVWSQGLLTFVPYGDETITANATTFTPNLTPVYDISTEDYSNKRGKGYVQIDRKVLEHAYNHIRLEIVDKDNNYLQTVVEAKDQADIDLRGLRSKAIQKVHAITNVATGRDIAQMILQRELYVRRTFRFALTVRYSLLDLMDLLTISDPIMGLNKQLVRIIAVEEQDDGVEIEAEEVLANAAHAPLYTTQNPQGYLPDFNVSPGSIAAPMLINAPALLAQVGYEVWALAYGTSVNWGGAQVWISENGVDYKQAGNVTTPGRFGTLQTALPAFSGGVGVVDNTNTLDVLLGRGALFSGTAQSRDEFRTLGYLESNGGEFIAYQTATLTAALRYSLTSMQRGGYATTAGLHAIGTRFARLDENIFRLPYDKFMSGKTVYFKFCSYNVYGAAVEALASVPAYTIVLRPNTGDGPVWGTDLGGNGTNLLWDEYTRYMGPTLPSILAAGTALTPTFLGSDRAIGLGGCINCVTNATPNGNERMFLSSGFSDFITPCLPGKYILSAYVNSPTAGHLVALRVTADSGPSSALGPDTAIVTANTWQRISTVIDLTSGFATMKSITPEVFINRSVVGGRTVKIDGLMFEPMVGANQSPSAYTPGLAGRAALAAQAAANQASSDAATATAAITDIASDNKITDNERPTLIKDRDDIVNNQSAIDTQATTYAVTTEKTSYDASISTLTTYLATLTNWNVLGAAPTTIVGTTLRQKFLDVYAARQVLLQKIADVVTYGNTGGNGANLLWDEYSRFRSSTLPSVNTSGCTVDSVVDAATSEGYALHCLTTNTVTSSYVYFGSTVTDYNLILTPGTYIISYYAKADGAGTQQIKPIIKMDNAASSLGGVQTLTGAYARYSTTITITNSTNINAALYFQINVNGVSGRNIWFDRIMVEQKLGQLNTPSPYEPGPTTRMVVSAQSAAAQAQTDANTANAALANIASDSLITDGERPTVIKDRDDIVNNQAAIDAQATSYGVTTEKTTYDSAITTLTTYLATVTNWNVLGAAPSSIVGTTFRQKFLDVYAARQALLQKIADVVTYGNTGGNGTNIMFDNYSRFLTTAVPDCAINTGVLSNITDANTAGGHALRVTTNDTNIAGSTVYFGNSGTEYNLPYTPNTSYIYSFRAKASVAGQQLLPMIVDDLGGGHSNATISLTTAWGRYSTVINIGAAASSKMLPRIYCNRNGVSGRTIDLDSIMIEAQMGSLVAPSPYTPGNAQRMATQASADAANALTAAQNAQTDATSALNSLVDISSDSLLTPGEKPTVIKDRDAITAEQAGIDAKATSYGITTEKTTYDSAVTALTTYLATLTAAVLWSSLTGNTTIVGTTFRQKFLDVYSARQALLNQIYVVAKSLADGAQTTANARNSTFVQGTAPTANATGDVWWDTTTNTVKRWNGAWVVIDPSQIIKTGDEAVVNGSFEADASLPPIGWSVTGTAVLSNSTAGADTYAGNRSLKLNCGATTGSGIISNKSYACDAGDNWTIRAVLKASAGNALLGLRYFDLNGAGLTLLTGARANVAYGLLSYTSTAPAGAIGFNIIVRSDTANAVLGIDTVVLSKNRNFDSDVDEGPIYGKYDQADSYISGTRRIGLRFGASGQRLGDARNLTQHIVGGGISYVPTVITYTSASGTPATATISVAAFTMISGSISVSYAAKTVGVTGTNGGSTTYYLYLDDPTFAGTGTLVASTTVSNAVANEGRVNIGKCVVTFPASGTGGGGGGAPCVCVDMWLDPEHMAMEAKQGMLIDCLDLPNSDVKFRRRIQSVRFPETDCVKITTDAGAVLDLSAITPFDLLDGRVAFAEDMLGEYVITDKGVEKVIEVLRLGQQPVAHISVGGISYAAGYDPSHRIYSHNTLKP